MKHML